MIPLYREDVGKEVLMELMPVYENYQAQEIEFFIGSRCAICANRFLHALPELLLRFTNVLSGLILLLAAAYFPCKRVQGKGLYALALYINVIDDEEAEYEESFMLAAYDEDGEVIEGAQQSFSIVDNETVRSGVTVLFDCEDAMELKDDSDSALLVFRYTGDFAVGTIVTLCYGDEVYDRVDFSQHQTVRNVGAVVGGIYALETRDGVNVDEGQAEVIDDATTTYSVEAGGIILFADGKTSTMFRPAAPAPYGARDTATWIQSTPLTLLV